MTLECQSESKSLNDLYFMGQLTETSAWEGSQVGLALDVRSTENALSVLHN